jgi:amino acid adenylation domain-containing protein
MAEFCRAASTDAVEDFSIVPVARDRDLPLSHAQRRLWFLFQLEPDNPSYNIPVAVRLSGDLSIENLERSLNILVGRHELLRARFEQRDGLPVQVVDSCSNFRLEAQDLRDLPVNELGPMLESRVRAEAERLFDLEHGPLLRVLLLRTGDAEHVLVLTMHHIICDGWSSGLVFKEIGTIYDALERGMTPSLPTPEVQYLDFASWQQKCLSDTALESQLDYWRHQLADLEPLALRTDRRRPAIRTFRGAEKQLNLPPGLVARLHQLAIDREASLFMILLAGLSSLLYRHGAGDDIAIGCPIAGRHHHQTENMIGFFINTLVMRLGITPGQRFDQLLAEARQTALDAYENQDLPFEKLVEVMDPKRDLSRNSMFDVFLNVINLETVELQLHDLSVTPLRTGLEAAKFDLTVYAVETPGELGLRFNYNADLFEECSIDRLMRHFVALLEAVSVDPGARISRIPLVDDALRSMPQSSGSDLAAARLPQEQTLTGRFRQQVLARPDAPAVVDAVGSWSYRDIDRMSDLVAQHLLADTGNDCRRVALLLGQDAQAIAAPLGVLKAGGAFVALDPFDPPHRLKELLADADAGAVLTSSRHRALAESSLPSTLPVICLDDLAPVDPGRPLPCREPDTLAYLLYTSGSTGRPKGLMQNDRNVIHHCTAYAKAANLASGERVSLLSSYTFDAAIVDSFGALMHGATLCMFDLREQSIERLAAWLERQEVVVYHSTPTVFRHMTGYLNQRHGLPQVRLVVLGGEPVYGSDLRLFKTRFTQGCRLLNLYGSTESSFSMKALFEFDDPLATPDLPIGNAVDATEVMLVDEDGEAVDVFGEIAITSSYLALGYWNAPELTAARFQTAAGGRRTYLSGDLGYQRTDGSIEFVGRRDNQVKLRGFRIEPGELESTLEQHPSVERALVVTRADAGGDSSLVAYVVASGAGAPVTRELREFLRGRLPGYMFPSAIVEIDAIPLTAGGKVRVAALPLPPGAADRRQPRVAPRNETERAIADIWCSVLAIDAIGVEDDFFELGGHSLKATRIRSRITRELGVQLPLRAFFENRTVADIAALVARQAAGDDSSAGSQSSILAVETVSAGTDELSDEQVEAMLKQLTESGGTDS